MSEFADKILSFIKEYRLFEEGILPVAFSGGADSTALLDVLWQLKRQGKIDAEIFAAHINHNLRGSQSDADEKFAKKFAAERGIATCCQSVDVYAYSKAKGVSIETAARQLRGEALCLIAKGLGVRTIATAHHKDDNAETIIHRLSRGTGLKGLGGIWQKRQITNKCGESFTFIRPLLCVSRREIEDYCRSRNIAWRVDSSNDELIYTRNVIRHKILPQLEAESTGDLSEKLNSLSDLSRRLYAKIADIAAEAWKEGVVLAEDDAVIIDAAAFNNLPEIVRQEFLRIAYNRLGGSELKITQQHYENLIDFAIATDSAKLQLPCEIYCFRGYGKLIFKKISDYGVGFILIDDIGCYKFKDSVIKVEEERFCPAEFKSFLASKKPNEEWFDAARISLPICVRSRETGDRFRPLGQKTAKRVGKFLIGARIDHAARSKIMVFEDAKKDIIWLAPHRQSDITKVNEQTREIYKITIEEVENDV